MTDRWIYCYSSWGAKTGHSDHMNEMAAKGWELVSANAAYDGSFVYHHFYWRKRA
ncbi:hypothetical protein [Amycolatopsis regifaucium]|uniref:hypothetical protein n=1 Tax=Amycolatopsis regifaucium TaxID=546365 RepID=UPI0008F665CA|nr:hypothetical protein [Amycolatopsis regifaucium]SFJ14966.1 hypothetical protein SAMN04489731_11651 [Amycolatopsis regifaucium]